MRFPILSTVNEQDIMFRLLAREARAAGVTLSGFSTHKVEVTDLPQSERSKLDELIERIVAGLRPGMVPIVGVLVVGHADQDQRGAHFEQQISFERATRVLKAISGQLMRRVALPPYSLLAKLIPMQAIGVGASDRVFINPKSEVQRAANRRVVVLLAEGIVPNSLEVIGPVPPQKALGPSSAQARNSLAVTSSFVRMGTFSVGAPLKGAPVFSAGQPKRPLITHDHGFLDDGSGKIDGSKRQAPTPQDQTQKEVWTFVLAASMRFHGEELKDANDAYKHFLIDNNGTARTINYEAFLKDDSNGQTVLASAIDDMRAGVLDVFDTKFPKPAKAADRSLFSVTSTHVSVGRATPDFRYPYPSAQNWQKAIGGHALWLSADVIVDSDPATNKRQVAIILTLHAEDMYNFNPGGADVSTGTADAINGRFEITGLGHEFLQTGTAVRKITFSVPNTKQSDNRVVPADQKVST